VDVAAAKAQQLGQGSSAAPCPLSLDMIAQYEEFNRQFKLDTHAYSGGWARRVGVAR
jgi:hypothetical protein